MSMTYAYTTCKYAILNMTAKYVRLIFPLQAILAIIIFESRRPKNIDYICI